MISISMCMIVKNEQDILARCLDSYAGTYDELIIVETGSTLRENGLEVLEELPLTTPIKYMTLNG